jgi:hypothetical protein
VADMKEIIGQADKGLEESGFYSGLENTLKGDFTNVPKNLSKIWSAITGDSESKTLTDKDMKNAEDLNKAIKGIWGNLVGAADWVVNRGNIESGTSDETAFNAMDNATSDLDILQLKDSSNGKEIANELLSRLPEDGDLGHLIRVTDDFVNEKVREGAKLGKDFNARAVTHNAIKTILNDEELFNLVPDALLNTLSSEDGNINYDSAKDIIDEWGAKYYNYKRKMLNEGNIATPEVDFRGIPGILKR